MREVDRRRRVLQSFSVSSSWSRAPRAAAGTRTRARATRRRRNSPRRFDLQVGGVAERVIAMRRAVHDLDRANYLISRAVAGPACMTWLQTVSAALLVEG